MAMTDAESFNSCITEGNRESRGVRSWSSLIGAVLVSAVIALNIAAETIDPANDGSQFAWSENAGWVNAEPVGNGGPGMSITLRGVTGWLWSENFGWVSLSCENTASCADVEYRLVQDAAGNLSGFGWSENAGWISFSCLNTGSCSTVSYGARVDLGTGDLTGYAWSENVGWISLSCANTSSCRTIDFGVATLVFVGGGRDLLRRFRARRHGRLGLTRADDSSVVAPRVRGCRPARWLRPLIVFDERRGCCEILVGR